VKTFPLALSAPLIATAGQLLLKHVMGSIGPLGAAELISSRSVVLRLLANPVFLTAVALYSLGFVIWLVVLSRLDLSYAYPIVALSFCLVPLLSHLCFGETVSPVRWLGIGVIFAGVAIVGTSK
jgi:drug/metabolite transporter (DMT)-like permease